MKPSARRPVGRSIAFALLALVLAGAQSLGLAHRVLHGAQAAAHAVPVAADGFGHGDGDAIACPLYDQLASGELLLAEAVAAVLPPPAGERVVPFATFARATAPPSPFRARAPPVFSA